MTQKLSGEERQHDISWEEAVSQHLRNHPDYFLHHPDILLDLTVPHPDSGSAISLLEYQMRLLREQNKQYSKQLRELVAIARDNDVVGFRLHRFALAMIDCTSLSDVLNTAQKLLREEFSLDAVVMLFQESPERTPALPGFVGVEDRYFAALLKRINEEYKADTAVTISNVQASDATNVIQPSKPVCGEKFDEVMMNYLFADRAPEIKSTAMVPLGAALPRGVLCLGSSDPNRFHPNMGTVYLVKLGALLMHSVDRHLH